MIFVIVNQLCVIAVL